MKHGWSWASLSMLSMHVFACALYAQRAAPIQALNITGLEGDLMLDGHYRNDEQTLGSGRVSTDTDSFLREELGLQSNGYFYHPNLVDWNASVRLGLSQQRIEIDGEKYDSDGDVTGYNLSALLLKEKPVSARVYARKTDDFIDRSFARRIEMNSRVTGAEVYYKGAVPMSLLYEQRDDYEESDIRTDDESSQLWRFQADDERDPDRYTQLVFEHEDIDKTATFFLEGQPPIIQDLPDRRDDLRVSNRWYFQDGSYRHSLFGQTRVLRRRGSFNNDLFSFNQRLELQHSDTLSTFYHVQASEDDTDVQDEERLEGEAGFIKQYYQSLTVTGRVFAVDNTIDASTDQTIGTFFDLDYRKYTPIGRYTSTLGIGTDREKQTTESGQLSVIDEVHVLAGVTPQQLHEPNVVPGSVVVTDSTNTVTYIEGLDYRIQDFGQFSEIVRLVGGSIPDGAVVLVDYSSGAAENARIQNNRINWRQRLQLGESPFALLSEYRLRDEKLMSGDDPGNLNREETMLFGLEYRLEPFTIVGEYETRDERLSPSSRAYRVRGTYDQVFNDTMTTTLGADYEKLNYTDAQDFNLEPGRDYLDRYRVYGHASVKLRRDLIGRLEASYSDMKGRENDRLARVGGSLDFRRGNLTFTINAYHEEYKQEDETGTSDAVRFTLRRSF